MAAKIESQSIDYKLTELLNEVKINTSDTTITTFIEQNISSIKSAINTIPQNLKVNTNLAPGFIKDIGVDKVKEFTFKKPVSVNIGGSYAINSLSKPYTGADVFIRLPKECFHEKDYLNHRYYAKRCLYLYVIKKYLSLSNAIGKIEWTTFQNEARKPVLIVYPVQELVELPGFYVRLIPTATSLFDVAKLRLSRNNLHNLNREGDAETNTPMYNSSILEDMFLEENSEFVKKVFLGWKELGEALILAKVWARQRSSIYTHDCCNGFLISVIMSYLTTKSGGNRINKSMKPMQILRVTLDFIASSKQWDKGLLLQPQGRNSQDLADEKDQGKRSISNEERKQYQQLFPAVLLDSSSHYNLAFRFSRSAFQEFREESSTALLCMDKCGDSGFEEIFMTKVDIPAKYDYCIRLNLSGNDVVYASGFCFDVECWKKYEGKVQSILEQGLTDRAKAIRVTWRSSPTEWNIEEGFSKFGSDFLLARILISNYEKSFRLVDIGPDAENKDEVIKFRKFWGEKAELRRFKDGTIVESMVWECGQWERHLIIKRISEYVLLRHLSLPKDNIVLVADQLDFSLLHGSGDPISFSANLVESFEVLSKRLRGLVDIPLRVSSVQPLDSAFRLTSVFPPEPHPLAYERDTDRKLQNLIPTCIQPLEVMIQLEGSGNWPIDEVAIGKTKSAFLLKIGESLQNTWGMTCIASEEDVNVLMSGYAFHLRILHERGLSLLKTQVGNTKRVSSADRELFIQGQHSSMINGLQGRYSIYGPVVRLAKRWTAAHMFSSYLAEEVIELLVAHLFLKPLPFPVPSSRINGILRFLRLLSNHDWTFTPLVIDINTDMTSKDEEEIRENFMLSRKTNEENVQNLEPAMFLATTYDRASEAWTRSSPTLPVLRRVMAYARSSADFLTNMILQNQIDSQKWECLFRTPLNNYDAVVLIHRDRLSFPQRLLFPSEMTLGRQVAKGDASNEFHPYMLHVNKRRNIDSLKDKVMVNFDPSRCFIEALQGEFNNTFKLWYDSVGSDAIGLTWDKPNSKKRLREEVTGENQDPIDILKDVGEIGKGFVRSVYLLKAPKLRN